MATSIAVTNYPTKIQIGGQDVGELRSIKMPQLTNQAVEITNVNSGTKEFVASGLKEISEFTIGVNYSSASISGSQLQNWVTSGSKGSWKIIIPTSPVTNWTFQAVSTGFKFNDMDASSPEALQAEITLKPSGDLTVS